MKTSIVRVVAFSEPSAAALAAAINAWLATSGEKTWIEVQYRAPSETQHTALLFYTD